MAGTEEYLLDVLGAFPEVARIYIRAPDGTVAAAVERHSDGNLTVVGPAAPADTVGSNFSAGDAFRFAILAGNSLAGEIFIEVDRAFVEQQFTDVFLDVAVVVLVVLLLAFEIVLATVWTSLSKPLDSLYLLLDRQAEGDFSRRLELAGAGEIGRALARYSDHALDLNSRYAALLKPGMAKGEKPDARLEHIGSRYHLSTTSPAAIEPVDPTDMRLPLFLFATGEELSKPFLPLLVQSAASETAWLSQEVLISLPLVAYLLALIALSPVAGRLIERFTPKSVFLAALLPVAISHVGLSFSSSVAEFVLWRGVARAGYALATIACQEYALDAAQGGKHGRALGGFVTVVMGGTFCGTALGGVLADRLGPGTAFLIGAALVAASGFIALRLMSRNPAGSPKPAYHGRAGIFSAFANPRFAGLLFGIAVPANILMAAFLWYVVPLALADLGSRPADIGRVLMIYYLTTILVAPGIGRLVDRSSGASSLLALGGVLSGLALVGVTFRYGFWPIAAAVAVSGLGHAVIRSTQVPLAIRIGMTGSARTNSAQTVGALRMWERAGSVAGLLLTGLFVGQYGYSMTIGMIGCLVVAGAFAFLAVEFVEARRGGRQSRGGGREGVS